MDLESKRDLIQLELQTQELVNSLSDGSKEEATKKLDGVGGVVVHQFEELELSTEQDLPSGLDDVLRIVNAPLVTYECDPSENQTMESKTAGVLIDRMREDNGFVEGLRSRLIASGVVDTERQDKIIDKVITNTANSVLQGNLMSRTSISTITTRLNLLGIDTDGLQRDRGAYESSSNKGRMEMAIQQREKIVQVLKDRFIPQN